MFHTRINLRWSTVMCIRKTVDIYYNTKCHCCYSEIDILREKTYHKKYVCCLTMEYCVRIVLIVKNGKFIELGTPDQVRFKNY